MTRARNIARIAVATLAIWTVSLAALHTAIAYAA